jgi:hypothetical protein
MTLSAGAVRRRNPEPVELVLEDRNVDVEVIRNGVVVCRREEIFGRMEAT